MEGEASDAWRRFERAPEFDVETRAGIPRSVPSDIHDAGEPFRSEVDAPVSTSMARMPWESRTRRFAHG